jgi:hypothetical protein
MRSPASLRNGRTCRARPADPQPLEDRSPAPRSRRDVRRGRLPAANRRRTLRHGDLAQPRHRRPSPRREEQHRRRPPAHTTPATPADRLPSSDSHDHETDVTRLRRSPGSRRHRMADSASDTYSWMIARVWTVPQGN